MGIRRSGTYEEGCADAGCEPGCRGDTALFENSWWNCAVVLLPELDSNKHDEKNTEHHEECDDATVVPRISAPTPLQCKQQAHNHGQEDERPKDIELLQLSFPAGIQCLCACALRRTVEDENEEERHCSNWQVDIEAPAPGDLVRECAALNPCQLWSKGKDEERKA